MGATSGSMPRGVEINGKKLRISFMYRNKRYREQLSLAATPANIKAASRMRETIVSEIEHGIFDYAKHFPGRGGVSEGSTFNKLADVWLASRKAEITKSTYVKYEQCMDQFWRPRLGDRAIASLLPSEVLGFVAEIDWSKLSPKRRNDALIPLRGVFQMAMDDDLIKLNPLARVKNKKPTPRQANPFSLAEAEAMLKLFPETVRPIYEVLFFTGMRPGELIELKWSDIDFERGTISVARNKCHGEVGDTKTHKPRTHEMVLRVKNALETVERKSDHVFIHPELGKPFHETRPIREVWWDAAMVASGLTKRELYQTRHTYATLAILAGANPYWIAQQMGTSPELIYKTYAKWLKGHSDGDKLNALIVS